MEYRTADGQKIPEFAFIVQYDDRGSYTRCAMTEEDFKAAFPLSDEQLPAVMNGDFLPKEFLPDGDTQIYAQLVRVHDSSWRDFFRNLTGNIPENENLEAGEMIYASISAEKSSPVLAGIVESHARIAEHDSIERAIRALTDAIDNDEKDPSSEETKAEVEALMQRIVKLEIAENPKGYERYFSYDDKISDETMQKAYAEFKKQKDYDSFESFLYSFVEEEWDMYSEPREVEECFKGDKSSAVKDFIDLYQDVTGSTLYDALMDGGFSGMTFDIKDLLDTYSLNLVICTDDEMNYDCSSLTEAFGYDYMRFEDTATATVESVARNPEDAQKRFSNGLSYLLAQQGYTSSELLRQLWQPDFQSEHKLIRDIANEFDNYTYYNIGCLTVPAKVGGEEALEVLEQLAKNKGAIVIPAGAEFGITNSWDGAGSVIEAPLEKDFVVPISMVRTQFESKQNCEYGGYTLDSIYGGISQSDRTDISVYKDESGVPVAAPEVKEEDVREVAKTFQDIAEICLKAEEHEEEIQQEADSFSFTLDSDGDLTIWKKEGENKNPVHIEQDVLGEDAAVLFLQFLKEHPDVISPEACEVVEQRMNEKQENARRKQQERGRGME